MQEFPLILFNKKQKDAKMQEFPDDSEKRAFAAQNACRFAGIYEMGFKSGKKPADLQEFTCVVEWDGWSERLTSGLEASGG
ncbi:hypothetical protein LBW89_14925 [Paenibacillus sp. alder61]|uniref:Uncharacterized protein n=1 Tax=Paenibacillus faecis TaxID=862114 RepID=A0A5D0CYG4_9BACL|nr:MULTISPECIES: hypothetical protein [Paenibacillus]MCA1294320.1 hypothetical protein [Paenibacillus sp. alder61]TYA15079.1 hypothetical protein FRY98_05315 [Paenibacillus faecis]